VVPGPPDASSALPHEGTTSNRYAILGRLAGGGMAEIFLVRATSDAGVERFVVLKRVLAERSRDPMFARMFLDEARLAAQLQHPNIAQVYDIGKLAGSFFFTMEYVHGEDVRSLLKRVTALRRQFPIHLACYIATGALAALHHAHERCSSDGQPLGIVHRDVSPSNVMVSYEGGVKLLDFGVAKAHQREAESRAGTIKGKIGYLSPEQCKGFPVDRRSDIYSLGIVLYELLTGKRLYRRDTDFATMMAIVQEPVPPPSSVRPEISADLDRVVLTALEKEPDGRFAKAQDMQEAIEAIALREQHALSGTAMGRFMRELFGDRPEPWIELQADEDARPITVTGESLSSGDVLSVLTAGRRTSVSDSDLRADDQFEAQIGQARRVGQPQSEDRSSGRIEAPRAATPLPTPAPAPPRTGPRALVIAATATAVLAIAGIAIALLQRSSTSPIDAAPAVASMPTEIPVAPQDAAVTVAVPIDAAVAAARPAPPPQPHIADLVAKGDHAGALKLCEHSKGLSADERTSCGVAACSLKQRATALAYLPGASKTVVERACREHGIVLVAAPVERPHGKPADPCDDRSYADAHPLKCQK
jgi:serine/threonine protein kinase